MVVTVVVVVVFCSRLAGGIGTAGLTELIGTPEDDPDWEPVDDDVVVVLLIVCPLAESVSEFTSVGLEMLLTLILESGN
jgi:hypothetical protein